MKTKHVLAVMITSFLLLAGCSSDDANGQESESASKRASGSNGSSEIHREYPKEKREVLATFGAIGASIMANSGTGPENMGELISFHDYEGYTFTEFNYDNNGVGHSYTAKENEVNERAFFGNYTVEKFAYKVNTLNIAVYYGNVANVTFISDFEVAGIGTINNLITLLFVKTDGEWKMVHEHHSPLKVDPSTGSETGVIPSEEPVISLDAQPVLATFGAIGASIMTNSGTGPENMDELISFHAYGRKFTEFNYDTEGNGYSFNSEDNETNEREFFGNYTVEKFAYKENTLNIAVYYGNVANVTFISDFEVAGIGTINNLITLLFVKTKGEWKLVHEHHSPENLPIS